MFSFPKGDRWIQVTKTEFGSLASYRSVILPNAESSSDFLILRTPSLITLDTTDRRQPPAPSSVPSRPRPSDLGRCSQPGDSWAAIGSTSGRHPLRNHKNLPRAPRSAFSSSDRCKQVNVTLMSGAGKKRRGTDASRNGQGHDVTQTPRRPPRLADGLEVKQQRRKGSRSSF